MASPGSPGGGGLKPGIAKLGGPSAAGGLGARDMLMPGFRPPPLPPPGFVTGGASEVSPTEAPCIMTIAPPCATIPATPCPSCRTPPPGGPGIICDGADGAPIGIIVVLPPPSILFAIIA